MQSRTSGLNRPAMVVLALLSCASVAVAQRPDPVDEARAADEPTATRDSRPVPMFRVFALTNSTADSVVETLQSLLATEVTSEELRLVADNRTNRVHALGTDDVLKKVTEMIRELDVAPQQQEADSATEVRIFTLQQVSAREAAEMLQSLYGDRGASPFDRQRGSRTERVAIAADERANSVIVSGSKDTLQTVEALLLRLDESERRDEAPQTEVIGMQGVPANDVAETLRRLGVSRVEVVADSTANQIVLRGDKQSVAQATDLLEKLYAGRRPQTGEVRLRVIWLVSPGLAGEDAADPPENLEKVLSVLKSKAGVGDLKLAAQFLLNASGVGGRQLSATGTTTLRSGRADISLDATIGESSGRSPLQIAIDVEASDEAGSGTICRLNTALSAPPGHPVVLGMTPIDSMNSVFVVEILPEDGAGEAAETEPAGRGGARR